MRPVDARMAALRAAGRVPPPRGRTLGEIALDRAAEAPGRLVIDDGVRALTRAETVDAALRLGAALRARGVGRGAAIAVQLPNWREACVIALAASLFGLRLVPLMPILRRAELGQVFAACRVEAVFVPGIFRGIDYPALIAQVPGAPAVVLRVRDGAEFEEMLAGPPADPDPSPADDAKLVIFTSGSTGHPKGVIHSHDAIDALIRDAAAFWGVGAEDRLYVPSPVGHVGGALYAFEFPWITGCSAHLEEVWDPARAVARIDAEGLTFMAGATPFLTGLLDAAEAAGTDLPSLRRFVCGGASVQPALVRRGLAGFPSAVVSRAYGSSEVPLVCPGLRDRDEAEAHADTDGECMAELRLLADDGAEAAPGAEGEVAVRAPQMLLGYLDPTDEAGAFTADGFFRMGDLARADGQFLTITGRKKDIIIRKGENISPLEIETALLAHPAVAACAVVGVPDAARGEMAVAFVVTRGGAAFDMAAMSAHLDASGLARQKTPERLEILPELPLSTVGKVRKDALRAMLAEKDGAA